MKIILFITTLFVVAILYSCDSGLTNGANVVFPDSNVTYYNHVDPFLKANCAYGGCHGYSNAGNVQLDDYYKIWKVPGLVIATKPDNSLLNQILENRVPHITYFYTGNISTNQIKGMRRWVLEGAILK